jgi:hypothetical protein
MRSGTNFVSDVVGGERLHISAIARELGVDVSTIHRWRARGVKGHKLASIALGQRIYVTRRSLETFLEAINGRSLGGSTACVEPDTLQQSL